MYDKNLIVKGKNITIADSKCCELKEQWVRDRQSYISREDFIDQAQDWFLSSKLVTLQGVDQFPHVDVTTGCTQYIESFFQRYGTTGFQILNREYAYYKLMGKFGKEIEDLEENKPLIISVPDFFTGGVRDEYEQVLKVAQAKNIDVHLDMAWIVMANDIHLDLSHPSIKSFAMSISKLNLNWNRVGLRWTKQRTMDSITILNHFHKVDIHASIMSCGSFMMNNLERDYAWNTYGKLYTDICTNLNLTPTKFVHCVNPNYEGVSSVTPLLLEYGC